MSCPAIAAVVADGSGLPMAATRRLQLAARASDALVMLARPQRDRGVISAAAMRWVVTPALSPGTNPRWIIELARAKGQSLTATATRWIVEKNREEGLVHLPAALCDRPAQATPAPRRRTA
jgi:protein ImuA